MRKTCKKILVIAFLILLQINTGLSAPNDYND